MTVRFALRAPCLALGALNDSLLILGVFVDTFTTGALS